MECSGESCRYPAGKQGECLKSKASQCKTTCPLNWVSGSCCTLSSRKLIGVKSTPRSVGAGRLSRAASGIFAVSEVQNQKGIGEDMDLSVSTGSFASGSKAAALVCRRLSWKPKEDAKGTGPFSSMHSWDIWDILEAVQSLNRIDFSAFSNRPVWNFKPKLNRVALEVWLDIDCKINLQSSVQLVVKKCGCFCVRLQQKESRGSMLAGTVAYFSPKCSKEFSFHWGVWGLDRVRLDLHLCLQLSTTGGNVCCLQLL